MCRCRPHASQLDDMMWLTQVWVIASEREAHRTRAIYSKGSSTRARKSAMSAQTREKIAFAQSQRSFLQFYTGACSHCMSRESSTFGNLVDHSFSKAGCVVLNLIWLNTCLIPWLRVYGSLEWHPWQKYIALDRREHPVCILRCRRS